MDFPSAFDPRSLFFLGLVLLLAQVQGQRVRARLERLVAVDPVTGLASAQGFRRRLDRAVGRSLRTGRISSVLILDLDDFEAMLAQHGPAPMARILEAFAVTLDRTLRESDRCGRLGGCRFAALLHHTQPMDALLAAERVRETWANLPLTLGGSGFLPTLSGGVASTGEPVADARELLALAEARAASARRGGGNNVESA
jgi:diguanylate cyclase (GGDEF)-like protein